MNLSKTALILSTVAMASVASARDQIQIAGSSTVLPFATIVAESFGQNTDFNAPVVESGGSGAGIKKFCEGVGDNTIDIANSSRKMKDSEVEECKAKGVTDIIEVRIGFDGIVFASPKEGNAFAFTPSDWYKALATKTVVDGKLVDNTAKTWKEVNDKLADQAIMAFIPGTKHGTREVFEEKVLLAGCKDTGAYDLILATAEGADDKEKAKNAGATCVEVRTDGVSVDVDGDYTETLASLSSNKDAIGVFGLSFYESNTDKLQVASVSDIVPSTETIANGTYPVSRPLFFYMKKQHIGQVPGLKEYAAFFVSEEVAGPDGPLVEAGMVADPELAKTQAAVDAETAM